MYRITYAQRAKIELQNSYNYIFFNLANPIAARNFKFKIIKTISNLEYFPCMGKKILNSDIRYIYFKNYLIIKTLRSNEYFIKDKI